MAVKGLAARERRERIGWCEVCEGPVYDGDLVLRDNNSRHRAFICEACFEKAGKADVVEWLNGSIEEAF